MWKNLRGICAFPWAFLWRCLACLLSTLGILSLSMETSGTRRPITRGFSKRIKIFPAERFMIQMELGWPGRKGRRADTTKKWISAGRFRTLWEILRELRPKAWKRALQNISTAWIKTLWSASRICWPGGKTRGTISPLRWMQSFPNISTTIWMP